jgi:DNA-binding transcriptional LysR family regulator
MRSTGTLAADRPAGLGQTGFASERKSLWPSSLGRVDCLASVTLQQLRYFLAAGQAGSFTAAADSLYIAQPSLAEQVRRLEGELGVKLFVRSGRRLTLTESGRALRPQAENVLRSVDEAAASVADVRHLRGGTASLGTFAVAYRFFVREVIAEFALRHPDVTVRVVGQNTVEVCEKIRQGELEAGLVTIPFDDSGLEVRPAMTEENLFASTDDSLEGPMTIERLASTRTILYDAHFGWRDPTRSQLAERARLAGVQIHPAIEVEGFDAALTLAARGFGGTFVLRTVVESDDFPASLRTVRFDPPLYDTFAFVWRRGTKLSPATQELIRLTEAHMARFGRPALPPEETGAPGAP